MNTDLVPIKQQKRLTIIGIIFFSIIGVLIIRLSYFQLFNRAWYEERAKRQWNSTSAIPATRGKIIDSNGEVLAEDGTSQMVVVYPKEVTAPDMVADKLSEILVMDRSVVYARITNKKINTAVLRRQVSDELVAEIAELKLKGVDFEMDVKRYYPKRNLLTQVLGLTTVDNVGIQGVEKQYDTILAGKNGIKSFERDAVGRQSPYSVPIVERHAQDGNTVRLTINYAIQSIADKVAAEALVANNAQSVIAIVMNPNTGAIYALSVAPGVEDLNNAPRSDTALLQSLTKIKPITDAYDPGSTFKIITTAAALQAGVTSPTDTFMDPGYIEVSGIRLRCWRSYNPHGNETLQEGLQNSCNPVFVTLGLRLGRERFYNYLSAFGIGSKTGIDLPGESVGNVRAIKYVTDLDLGCMAFGQSLSITPIQLVNAICACINGGNLMQPYLVDEIIAPNGVVLEKKQPTVLSTPISAETSATLRTMLQGVVTNNAKAAAVDGYTVGGKTGTAQKVVDGAVSNTAHVSSFIGFAPVNNPQLLVYVAVDEPNIGVNFGSVVAAPYAQMIMEEALHVLKVPYDSPATAQGYGPEQEVPDVGGKTIAEAITQLQGAGFQTLAEGGGTVAVQVPAAGAMLPQGGTVLLTGNTVAIEEGDLYVPDVSGMTVAQAREKLTEFGLLLIPNGAGLAVSQSPVQNSVVAAGTSVQVEFRKPQTE